MLSCQRVIQFLSDYVGRELPLEYAELVREHLGSCPSCADLESSYQKVIDWGRRLPALPIPPEVLHRLRRAVVRDDTAVPPEKTAHD
ncbi:MAG TPA: zf-HC2 domain-containing protein [Gemmataceae bacterium]|jgi:anti-sigma factor RsiW